MQRPCSDQRRRLPKCSSTLCDLAGLALANALPTCSYEPPAEPKVLSDPSPTLANAARPLLSQDLTPAQGSPSREQHLEQHWLTVGEAARALGVSPQTVRNRVATGELEARKGNRGPLQVLVTAGPDLGEELARAREEVAQLEVKLAEAISRLALADQRAAMLEGERDRLLGLFDQALGPPTVVATVRRWVVRMLEPKKG